MLCGEPFFVWEDTIIIHKALCTFWGRPTYFQGWTFTLFCQPLWMSLSLKQKAPLFLNSMHTIDIHTLHVIVWIEELSNGIYKLWCRCLLILLSDPTNRKFLGLFSQFVHICIFHTLFLFHNMHNCGSSVVMSHVPREESPGKAILDDVNTIRKREKSSKGKSYRMVTNGKGLKATKGAWGKMMGNNAWETLRKGVMNKSTNARVRPSVC